MCETKPVYNMIMTATNGAVIDSIDFNDLYSRVGDVLFNRINLEPISDAIRSRLEWTRA